jgi:hypothetical protein
MSFNLQLINDFPDMFQHIGAPGMVSTPPGWEPIAKQFCTFCANTHLDIDILQIKQKFGGLRIYYQFHDGFDKDERVEILQGYLLALEAWARHTCQYCGLPGEKKTLGGYMCIICPQCEQEKATDYERH